MKHILLFCNYYEGRTGNLEKTLESWSKCKLEFKERERERVNGNDEIIVGIVDNGSKDNSMEVIKKYINNGFIDYSIFNTKNVGKPLALNRLLMYILAAKQLNEEDYKDVLIYSIDSDIRITKTYFISKINNLFENKKDISLMSSKILDENYNDTSAVHTFVHTGNIICFEDEKYEVVESEGIGGGLFVVPLNVFLDVGGYCENAGHLKKSAIYGGDDALLLLFIHKKYEDMKTVVCNTMEIIHPNCDDAYKNWKEKECRLMCQNGFGNDQLSQKGFYDE